MLGLSFGPADPIREGMTRGLSGRHGLLLLVVTGAARGADRWAQLRLGMTTNEAVSALGEPLVRSAGRGFELWIYDHDAEVLFFGDLVGWTTPGTGPSARHSADVWQANQGQDDFRAVLARLPAPRSQPARRAATAPAAEQRAIAWRPALRFRP